LTRRSRENERKRTGLEFNALSVEDFEREATKHLDQSQIDYVYRGTETEFTLDRNKRAFQHFLLERRVLQGIKEVNLGVSYFNGRLTSELPFFPAPVNCSPLYPNAILDLLKVTNAFSIPVFVSQVAVLEPLKMSNLPSLVKNKGSSLIWQIYMRRDNVDRCYRQAGLAESWGYKGLAITVDTELDLKLGNEVPTQTSAHSFISVTSKEIKKLRQMSKLPLIVKGVMNADDSELAIESGADGVIVSNHGARNLDHVPSTLEVLPGIVRRMKSKKSTRGAEIFFDGGIRRGTDALVALALGAKGCLLGRPVLWAMACDHERGVTRMMKILKEELQRAAWLCGASNISSVNSTVVRKADF
jgi:4-hydroxymandelate oxidase